MTNYVLSSILWALAGLVSGYAIGRAGRVAALGDNTMYSLTQALYDLLARAFDARISRLERVVKSLHERTRKVEIRMAKDREALARLDEQITALRAYVASDEETDAAEVDKRTASIRQILVDAQGSGQVAPEEAAKVEEQLAEVADEAAAQTGTTAEAPADGTDAAR